MTKHHVPARTPSTECPRCQAFMAHVEVRAGRLRACCDTCGWSGSKRPAPRSYAPTAPVSKLPRKWRRFVTKMPALEPVSDDTSR